MKPLSIQELHDAADMTAVDDVQVKHIEFATSPKSIGSEETLQKYYLVELMNDRWHYIEKSQLDVIQNFKDGTVIVTDSDGTEITFSFYKSRPLTLDDLKS